MQPARTFNLQACLPQPAGCVLQNYLKVNQWTHALLVLGHADVYQWPFLVSAALVPARHSAKHPDSYCSIMGGLTWHVRALFWRKQHGWGAVLLFTVHLPKADHVVTLRLFKLSVRLCSGIGKAL